MELEKICGLKVICIKGRGTEFRTATEKVQPMYILFSDKRTFIELSEQDYHSYHDSSPIARELSVIQDTILWKEIYEKYPDADTDF